MDPQQSSLEKVGSRTTFCIKVKRLDYFQKSRTVLNVQANANMMNLKKSDKRQPDTCILNVFLSFQIASVNQKKI